MDWTVQIDFGRDGTFGHSLSDVTGRVRDIITWTAGWPSTQQVESNVSAHISPVNTMQLILDNSDGMLAFENTLASFHNLIHSGLMVRVTVEYGIASHSFTYYTESIRPAPGQFGMQTVSIMCVCVMPRVQRARIDLEVQTNISTSDAV